MTAKELEGQYKKLGFWALIAVVLVLVAMVLAPFAQALMWSVILSVLTYPLYRRLCGKFSETISALLTIFSTMFLVAIPLGLVGLLVFLQFRGVVDDFESKPVAQTVVQQNSGTGIENAPVKSGSSVPVPSPISDSTVVPEVSTKVVRSPAMNSSLSRVAKKVDEALAPHLKRFGIDFNVEKYIQEHGPEITQRITGPITRGAASAAVSVVMMVVAFLTMFFMLRDGHKLLNPAVELLPLPEKWTRKILARVQQTIHAVFMGVILVAFMQGVIAGIGYLIAGIDAWLVWGAATVVLCAVPLLGAPVVYVPLALLLLSQGKIWQGIFLLVWGFGLVSNIDNFLRPKYIGERVGLHYIAIFFSLLGGVLAFGPVGLMVGPVLLTVFLELIQYSREMRADAKSSLESDSEDALLSTEIVP